MTVPEFEKHWLAGEIDDPSLSIDRGISYALALAIGHSKKCIALSGDCVQVAWMNPKKFPGGTWDAREQRLWRSFDYRDPAIAWAVAKHYRCFPIELHFAVGKAGEWHCSSEYFHNIWITNKRSPEEAVAQLIITVASQQKGGVWML